MPNGVWPGLIDYCGGGNAGNVPCRSISSLIYSLVSVCVLFLFCFVFWFSGFFLDLVFTCDRFSFFYYDFFLSFIPVYLLRELVLFFFGFFFFFVLEISFAFFLHRFEICFFLIQFFSRNRIHSLFLG